MTIPEVKAKAKLIISIITARNEAIVAGIEDPEKIILETIEAQKDLKIFLEHIIPLK